MQTKRITFYASFLSLILLFLFLIGCSKQGNTEASADVKSADALALTYIQASVEFDDDLFKTILLPEQPRYRNLKEGEHTKPGAFEELGEKYSIFRYSEEPNEKGQIFYRVSYFLDNHQKYFFDLLSMSKVDGEWKIREIDEEEMLRNANPDEAIIVHKSDSGE
ncbi:hypothetical protein J45TS6_45700 [Paenibacillus sp. J45TS6]|uniref:hypothetical protein n=1 Tax=unclassified Paenibacillus TaxID=185978 RepID=UPI00191DEB1E|nr:MULTISPECIES: hypothetical protein [unclassified Paenibacillus]BCO11086.1 hypothetical protein [Paenibacillus sp.]GIP46111.1 hypothetical protein J45TS6_45700 [Paenibacillus sp. J45TS6]